MSTGRIDSITQKRFAEGIIRGALNCYGKFSTGHLRFIWNNLKKRLMKWVQWEKRLYVMASLKWLWKKYKQVRISFLTGRWFIRSAKLHS